MDDVFDTGNNSHIWATAWKKQQQKACAPSETQISLGGFGTISTIYYFLYQTKIERLISPYSKCHLETK